MLGAGVQIRISISLSNNVLDSTVSPLLQSTWMEEGELDINEGNFPDRPNFPFSEAITTKCLKFCYKRTTSYLIDAGQFCLEAPRS